MKNKQNHRCKICGRIKPLLVDHDHKTNNIRGLLCRACNVSLGNFKDNTLVLVRAIKYLRKEL